MAMGEETSLEFKKSSFEVAYCRWVATAGSERSLGRRLGEAAARVRRDFWLVAAPTVEVLVNYVILLQATGRCFSKFVGQVTA
jgi:hypothetical protein